jgi:hypothetical protein
LTPRIQTGTAPKKHHHHGVKGLVTKVDGTKGLIEVKVHHHSKSGNKAASSTTEVKFHTTTQTVFQVVIGPKGKKEHKPATFADVRVGAHVHIVPQAGHHHLASKVEIVAK